MTAPVWLKPPPWVDHPEPQSAASGWLARSGADPVFLREVGAWDVRWQRMLFQILVPASLLAEHHIDPVRLTDPSGAPVAFARPGADRSSWRLELYPYGGAADPMGEIEMADTMFNRIEVLWVALQDPSAPRFDTDVMPDGEPTLRGTVGRNLPAEAAAMASGLAPGQVRQGLRSLRWLADRLETMMLCLNQREYVVQPLYYHTAVLFEQNGFSYVQGQARMETIALGFAPGGTLRQRLDGSSPFRQPWQADSVRGRSWAIHDGILDERWDRVRMVKRVGSHAGIGTSPGTLW